MTFKMHRAAPTGMAFALVAAAWASHAHHSFAMYDQTRLVILNGTVKDFQWSNPHSVIFVVRAAAGGRAEEEWSVELPTSPGNLSRLGWSKHSLKPGDKVSVEVNPLRDGHHGGSLKKVTLSATGDILTVGAPPATPTPAPAR